MASHRLLVVWVTLVSPKSFEGCTWSYCMAHEVTLKGIGRYRVHLAPLFSQGSHSKRCTWKLGTPGFKAIKSIWVLTYDKSIYWSKYFSCPPMFVGNCYCVITPCHQFPECYLYFELTVRRMVFSQFITE